MSMIGEYARLTSAELERAVQNPRWAREFIDELIDAALDEGASTVPPRCLDINKAWDTLRFLLRRIDFPVDIVHGEEETPGAEDWGYGPPRYLTPEQVRTASAALATTSGDALMHGVTAA
ncbi:YfbM family protein [Streptomyces sp. NPDC048521]|uniref:YfbM family protein n=1 Tax=Streptomyces sp. NPDC048521 TaxID=3365566 RepID=UPI0037209AB9